MLNRLKELLHELECIQYGKFKLASGSESNYKINCDSLFESAEAREILGTLGYGTLREIEKTGEYELVGVVTGGNELAKIIAERCGKEVVSVNPHNGEIGKIFPTCRRKCYMDDVVTSGGSILKCRNAIGMRFDDDYALAIVDREEGGKEILRKNGIELRSLLTKSELGI